MRTENKTITEAKIEFHTDLKVLEWKFLNFETIILKAWKID